MQPKIIDVYFFVVLCVGCFFFKGYKEIERNRVGLRKKSRNNEIWSLWKSKRKKHSSCTSLCNINIWRCETKGARKQRATIRIKWKERISNGSPRRRNVPLITFSLLYGYFLCLFLLISYVSRSVYLLKCWRLKLVCFKKKIK